MSEAFVAQLEQLLAALDDAPVVTSSEGPPLRLEIVAETAAAGAACLPVVVVVEPHAIAVELGGWVRSFAREGEIDDEADALALDLVAAALLGRVRVLKRALPDGRAIGHEVSFAAAGDFVPFDHDARWHWPWQRVTTTVMCNAEQRPRGLALGRSGVLPRAPWSGTLAAPTSAAALLPIDGELDLHNFSPKEVDPLVRAYIDECLARGIFHLRIVHGKGIGALRRTVQAILSRHPAVESQRLGGHGEGSWGATIVTLRARKE